VLLATHDRDLIQRSGKRVLTLDKGRLVSDIQTLGTDPPKLEIRQETPAEEPVS
jgi:ABC-type uncharacterized transport system ATPase subunit